MNISWYAADAGNIDELSKCQIANLFRQHESIMVDRFNHTARSTIGDEQIYAYSDTTSLHVEDGYRIHGV
jgi:hypothetical protein